MVNNLFRKYLSDELNVIELEEFRMSLDSGDQPGIDSALEDLWQSTTQKRNVRIWWTAVACAAACAMVVFAVMLGINSNRYKTRMENLAAQELVFRTDRGEHATVSLPDGSQVSLNYSSCLRYNPGMYDNEERCVSFEGEGYFRVQQNPGRPFVITSEGLEVRVLGTSFDLKAYKKDRFVELTLDEGRVMFTSLISKEEVVLNPSDMLRMDYESGKCEVFRSAAVQSKGGWTNGGLSFKNETLHSILKTLEDNYNVEIALSDSAIGLDTFSGTLPADNLAGAIEIIEYSYQLSARINGRRIELDF